MLMHDFTGIFVHRQTLSTLDPDRSVVGQIFGPRER